MNDKVKQLQELCKGLEDFSPEKLEAIVNESLSTFENIMTRMLSSNLDEREQALKEANALRETLEKEATKAMAQTGLTEKQLDEFISDPNNFSPEEWSALQKAKEEFTHYEEDLKKEGLISEENSPVKKKKVKKAKSNWIQS
jgi:hypothetical protein